MKKLLVALALGFAFTQPSLADGPADLLVMVNSGNAQTQGMAFVLATPAMGHPQPEAAGADESGCQG